MTSDLVNGAEWHCARTPAGALAHPDPERFRHFEWMPANVPGTAAEALRAAGAENVAGHDYDSEDWWFRCRFEGRPGTWRLRLHGIATLADVWVNGAHVARSENMFVRSSVELRDLLPHNELVIRCESLSSVLGARRPRPRWKTAQVEHQGLRWVRSSLLGRIPGWAQAPRAVGPWRPVEVTQDGPLGDADVLLAASCVAGGGRVDATVRIEGDAPVLSDRPALSCGGETIPFELHGDAGTTILHASLPLDRVERWWPHTHGPQPLYDVELRAGSLVLPLGRVGFRTVEVDRADGGFAFVVNDVPVFIRGANWFPPDPVSLTSDDEEVRRRLGLAREAHLNMLRVPGTTAYADRALLEGCDELGILVWHDCMFAYMDYPDDEGFVAAVTRELDQAFAHLSSHPALAIVCGNQEVDEIAAMSGAWRTSFESELFDKVIPSLASELLPGVEYVSSNPSGGDPLFRPDTGVSQYFGVGGYLRPLGGLRRDRVRFAAECLCLSTPPEPEAVDRFGGPHLAGHDPRWKSALHHDAGRSWDMEDVRSYYLREIFGVDPFLERYVDAERALDLGRATNAILVESVFSEWRCTQPSSGGGLVLGFNDVAPGPGWGLVDVDGQPKATWFSLRRAAAPLSVRFIDEGLNGLHAHLFNEAPTVFQGTLTVDLYANGETLLDQASLEVLVQGRGCTTVNVNVLFDGFPDLNYAHRYGPAKYDVVVGRLSDEGGQVRSEDVFLPLGQGRSREVEVGLDATWTPGDPDPVVRVTTRRFAQWVSVDAPCYRPSDSWFHLPPHSERLVTLLEGDPSRTPRGRVRSLNSLTAAVLHPLED